MPRTAQARGPGDQAGDDAGATCGSTSFRPLIPPPIAGVSRPSARTSFDPAAIRPRTPPRTARRRVPKGRGSSAPPRSAGCQRPSRSGFPGSARPARPTSSAPDEALAEPQHLLEHLGRLQTCRSRRRPSRRTPTSAQLNVLSGGGASGNRQR